MALIGGVCLWAMLATRRFLLAALVVAAPSVLVALCGPAIFVWVEPRVRPADWPLVVAAFRCVAGTALVLAIGYAVVARACGYRLVWQWPWAKSRPSEAKQPISQAAVTGAAPP
jgi:hypothetical protein